MHFPDEIRAINQVPNLPANTDINEKELNMAKMLIEQLSAPFDAAKYTDDYRMALLEAIQSKIAGEGLDVIDAPAAGKSNVIDLMDALKASLEATKPKSNPKRKSTAKSPAKKKETVS